MARRLLAVALLVLVAFGAGLSLGRSGRLSGPPIPSADLSGPVAMVDADTLDVGGTRVRLFGVDAPEAAQTCEDPNGDPWPCGTWAAEGARHLWDGKAAACDVLDTDRYGRQVARCAVGGEDLGATLVERGMALAYLDYSDDYLPQQEAAERAAAGVWQGRFQAPWDWRRAPGLEEVTEVATVAAEDEECLIKGNISSTGRIYHLPGSPSYDRTAIDEGAGERWFCTVAEAEAAGWRAPRG